MNSTHKGYLEDSTLEVLDRVRDASFERGVMTGFWIGLAVAALTYLAVR